jgi:ribonuclease D
LQSLPSVIADPQSLGRLAASLESAPAVALDTEFLRSSTYRAQLCLLQIADAEQAVCVDPLGVDLAPLAPLLTASRALKVMHAARQDIEVMLPAVGMVEPLFDTQVAAALVGMPAQIGYAELVRRLLGQELSKAHTRTDWSARPLSPAQISYALDDVRYLLPLHAHLAHELERLGRSAWLQEELTQLRDRETYETRPADAWRRMRGFAALDTARQQLARELAAWREQRAIDRNRPRGWILEDAALREIVLRAPRSTEELAKIPGLPAGVVKHCGAEIVKRIRAADLPDELPRVNLRVRPEPARDALVRKLSAVHQAIAAELALQPEVLATRRDLEQLADGERELPVLRGWRRAIIGERLIAAL